MSEVHCIYHGGCPDGFTAAWVIRKRLGENVVFHEGKYGEPPPDMPNTATVYIVDFSYPRDQLVALARRVHHIEVYDHHASAERDLEGIEDEVPIVVRFDMGRSGAGITWDEMYPDLSRPGLVAYVEDRDLWRFWLPSSESVAPIFMATPMTFGNWDYLHNVCFDGLRPTDETIAKGKILQLARDKVIDELARLRRRMLIGGIAMPVAPSPYSFGSDVAGVLAEQSAGGVGAYYVDRPECRQFGLRSVDGGRDVSLIAEAYGGGGHPHAAGFKVEWGADPLAPTSGSWR